MNSPSMPHLPWPLDAVTPDGIAGWLATLGMGEGVAQASGLLVTIAVLYAAVMLPFALVAALLAWNRGVGSLRGFGCGLAFGLAGVAFVRGMLPGWGLELSRKGERAEPARPSAGSPRPNRCASQRTERGRLVSGGTPRGSVGGIASFAGAVRVSPSTPGWPSARGVARWPSGAGACQGSEPRW